MTSYRYSRWNGRQDLPTFNEDLLMDQVSDQILGQGDLTDALRSLVQRGAVDGAGQKVSGVQDLLQQLRSRRQRLFDTYDLGSVLKDISRKLKDIVDAERQGIDSRLQEMRERASKAGSPADIPQEELLQMMEQRAQSNRNTLDSLPQEPLETLRHLQEYEFMDAGARDRFQELLKELQQKVIDSRFKDLSQRLQSMSPQEMSDLKEMLRDLNRLLDEHWRGDNSGFQQFMEKHGHLWGPNPPSSPGEILDRIQQQAEQMQSLLNSMSQDMRKELRGLLSEANTDPELRQEMSRLGTHLRQLYLLGNPPPDYLFRGQDPLTLEEAVELMEQLQGLNRLEEQLKNVQRGGSLEAIDEQLLNELLGDEASQDLTNLHSLATVLEKAGYVRKVGSRFELTPRGVRKIGQRALQEIFLLIKRDHIGPHRTRHQGKGGEHQGDTKRHEFGDPFILHLQKSLMNAVTRDSAGIPVRLQGEDFEVYRLEQLSQASTVLMVDLSLSMAMRGNFLAAKKVALALDNLIRTQFSRDELWIVGFSTHAREVKPEDLPYLSWDELDPYTNIQQGLALCQRLLSRSPAATKQIILISDGEPTAHMEAGQLFIQYPPSPRTIQATLKEVKRCTRLGILITTFMLDRNTNLSDFVEQMARINRGKVFYTSPERLGEYILVDYLSNRQQVLR